MNHFMFITFILEPSLKFTIILSCYETVKNFLYKFSSVAVTFSWIIHLQTQQPTTCPLIKVKISEYPLSLPSTVFTPRSSNSLSSIHEEIRKKHHTLSTPKRPVDKAFFRQSWILQTMKTSL